MSRLENFSVAEDRTLKFMVRGGGTCYLCLLLPSPAGNISLVR